MNLDGNNNFPEMVDVPMHIQQSLSKLSIKNTSNTEDRSNDNKPLNQHSSTSSNSSYSTTSSNDTIPHVPDQNTNHESMMPSSNIAIQIPGSKEGKNSAYHVLPHGYKSESIDNFYNDTKYGDGGDDYDDDYDNDYDDSYEQGWFDSKIGSESSFDSLNLILEKQRQQQLNNPFHQAHIFCPVKETNKISLEYDPVSKKTMLNHYEIIKELGHGQHGKVKLAKDLHTSKLVAIKILDRVEPIRNKLKHFNNTLTSDGLIENASVKKEINIMKRLHHEHIVKLLEVLDDIESRKIYLVLEYCSKGEIRWCLGDQLEIKARGPPLLSFHQARKIFRDVVLGLEYLHSKGVLHRDIKPANLLWNDESVVKISDFGVSLSVHSTNEEELCKTAGSPAFYSPEICLGVEAAIEKFGGTTKTIISYPVDIWALGITLYCLLFGKLPFICQHEMQLFDKIINEKLEFPQNISSYNVETKEYHQAQSLILQLLEKNPYKRLTIKDIKQHPFTLYNLSQTEKDFFLQSQYQLNDDLLYMDNNEFLKYNEISKQGIDDMGWIDRSITKEHVDNELGKHQRHSVSHKFTHETSQHPRHQKHAHHSRYKDSKIVSLPVNSSFASLDSFYIDSYVQSGGIMQNHSNTVADQRNYNRRLSNSSDTPSSNLMKRLTQNNNMSSASNSGRTKLNNPIDIPHAHVIPLQKIIYNDLKPQAGPNYNMKTKAVANHKQTGYNAAYGPKKNDIFQKNTTKSSSVAYNDPSNSIPSNAAHYLHPASSFSSSNTDLTRAASTSSDSSSEYGYYASTNNKYLQSGSDTESLPFEFRVDSAHNSSASVARLNANSDVRPIAVPQHIPLPVNISSAQTGPLNHQSNIKKKSKYIFSSSSESDSNSSFIETESMGSFEDNGNNSFIEPHTDVKHQLSSDESESSVVHPSYNESDDEFVLTCHNKQNVLNSLKQTIETGRPELDSSSTTICATKKSEIPMAKESSVSTLQEVEQLDIPQDILMKLTQSSTLTLNSNKTSNTSKLRPSVLASASRIPDSFSNRTSVSESNVPSSGASTIMKPGMESNMFSKSNSTTSAMAAQRNRNNVPTTVTHDVGVLSERTKNDFNSMDLLHSVLTRKGQDQNK